MEFVDLHKVQLGLSNENDLKIRYKDFIKSYYSLFCSFNNVDVSENRLMEIINENISKIETTKQDEILEFSLWLKNRIINTQTRLKEKFGIVDIPDTVLFIGDGSIDGHGVVVDKDAYAFFELTTLENAIKLYDADVFLAHELIHPIHYQSNSDFFSKNWFSVEEFYFKRMITEGISTYFSKYVNTTTIEQAYWFGFLEEKDLHEWINYCEDNKYKVSLRLKKSINENKIESDLYRQLFSIVGYENLTNFRLAYYYGAQIIEIINKELTFEQILNMRYTDIRHYILGFFDINNLS